MLVTSGIVAGQHISEFHYDNIGTDQGEFIEVVIPDPQPVSKSEFKIFIYNGGDSLVQYSRGLQGITPSCATNLCYYIWTRQNLLQNGPEAIAFMQVSAMDTTIFDFISYEGEIVALDGPANGMISADVGIQEDDSTPVGWSLQKRSDGSWFAGPETRGSVNPIELFSFEGRFMDDPPGVLLEWRTATEINNQFFEIQKSKDQRLFKTLADVPGAGNSQEVLEYSYLDADPYEGTSYYRLKQVDYGGTYAYSPMIAVENIYGTRLSTIKPFLRYGKLYFRHSSYRRSIDISLYDGMGRRLMSRMNINLTDIIPVNICNDGIIFYHIRSQGLEHSGRILVIER